MSNSVNGKMQPKPTVTVRIVRVLDVSARFWVDLQANANAFDAEKEVHAWKPARLRRTIRRSTGFGSQGEAPDWRKQTAVCRRVEAE